MISVKSKDLNEKNVMKSYTKTPKNSNPEKLMIITRSDKKEY